MRLSGQLRAIHAGNSQRRVILFPGILGNLTGYTNVVTVLNDSCSFFGLRYPLNIDNASMNALQALGEQCARHILALTDTPPTHLLGWSLGGLVARECGAAMHARGRPADSVVMVDPARQTIPQLSASRVVPSLGRDELKELLWRRFLSLKCDGEVARQILADHDFFGLSERERFKLVERYEKKWSRQVLPPVGLRTSFRLMSMAYQALQTYVPSRCPGPMYAICSDRYWGSVSPAWQEDPADTTRIVRVQGDHLTVILHFAIPAIVEIISGTAAH